jgi:hypothetical protein
VVDAARLVGPGPAPGLVWVLAADALALDPRTGEVKRRWAGVPHGETAFDPSTGRVAVAERHQPRGTRFTLHPAERPPETTPVPGVGSPAFAADGRTLAACETTRVRLWYPATGHELLGLDAGGTTRAAAFTRDGLGLAAVADRPGGRRVAVFWGAEP